MAADPVPNRLSAAYSALGYSSKAVGSQEMLSGVKHAYAHSALKAHPDKGGSKEKFTEVKDAYDVISATKKNVDKFADDVLVEKYATKWLGHKVGRGQGVSSDLKRPEDAPTTAHGTMKGLPPPSTLNLKAPPGQTGGLPSSQGTQTKEETLARWLWEERENDLTRRLVFVEQLLARSAEFHAKDHKGDHKARLKDEGGGRDVSDLKGGKKTIKEFKTLYAGPYAMPGQPMTTTFYMEMKAAREVERKRITHAHTVAAQRHDHDFVTFAHWLSGLPATAPVYRPPTAGAKGFVYHGEMLTDRAGGAHAGYAGHIG